jgi:hypothetical protein
MTGEEEEKILCQNRRDVIQKISFKKNLIFLWTAWDGYIFENNYFF